MSWRDSDSGGDDPIRKLGGPGGDWRGIHASLDNPMTWALPAGRVAGIVIRVHLIFLLFVLVELARSIAGKEAMGVGIVAIWIAALFAIVLLHEFGHCIACRYIKGSADEILMWPLGGLAYCQPPSRWQAHLITAIGGPLVNVVICAVLAPVLWIVTGTLLGVALPNPMLGPSWPFGELPALWLQVLFIIHQTSLMLLLFNLVPVFPLDGGRIAQAILWRSIGYVRSMRITVRVGYFAAIAMGLFGAVTGQWILIAIALFGGITCYMTHKQLEWTQETLGFEDDAYAISLATGREDDPPEPASEPPPSRADRKSAKARQAAVAEEAELDRILEKIASTGIESLSSRESRLLQRATERKQQKQ